MQVSDPFQATKTCLAGSLRVPLGICICRVVCPSEEPLSSTALWPDLKKSPKVQRREVPVRDTVEAAVLVVNCLAAQAVEWRT